MSTIDSVMRSTYAAGASAGSSKSSSGGMSVSDFYKVLAAQLKYQDADNPMNTSEMMAQMVQTQMISAITEMTTTNTISYATSMMGRDVTMAEIDAIGRFTGETTSGTVTGVMLGDMPIVYIGDKGYFLSQIMNVGEVPEKPEDPDADAGDKGDAGDTGGDNGSTETN